jgi:RNA polymerase sigma factor (sigma-70 family)
MNHHIAREYAHAVEAERLDAAAGRRPPAPGDDLERLVAMASAGHRPAWNELVERFEPYLLRVARAHGLSSEQAEDAVQETWIRLLRNIGSLREPQALGGWLKVTVRRESLRIRERAQRERPTAENPWDGLADSTEDHFHGRPDAAGVSAAIARALESLPDRHRALMHALFADSAPSYQEIAANLGMPVGSIGPIRGRCLAQMRLDTRLQRVASDSYA